MSHVRHHPRSDDGNAFIPDPEGGPMKLDGDVDEELTEDFMLTVTSGNEAGEDVRNQHVPEDEGGPFIMSTSGEELADDIDESNPADADREASPSPMRGRS